jgi:hypothetical protein
MLVSRILNPKGKRQMIVYFEPTVSSQQPIIIESDESRRIKGVIFSYLLACKVSAESNGEHMEEFVICVQAEDVSRDIWISL